jgi:hypothetical protein
MSGLCKVEMSAFIGGLAEGPMETERIALNQKLGTETKMFDSQRIRLASYNDALRSGQGAQIMAISPSILKVLLAILGMVWLFRQVRKPSGPLGKYIVGAMNLSHAAMTDWALQYVMVPKDAVILDVGCGGGRTLLRLSAIAPEGKTLWAGLLGRQCRGFARYECPENRVRASSNRAGFGGSVTISRSHVRHRHSG